MKKATTTVVLAILATISLRAQEGEIINVNYGANGLTHEFAQEMFNWPEYQIWDLDLDQNGTDDFHYIAYLDHYGPETWGCCNWVTLSFQTTLTPEYPLPNVASELQIGDTISNPDVSWLRTYQPPYTYDSNSIQKYLAFRMVKDEDLYYGWIEQDVRYVDTVVIYYGNGPTCLNKAVVSIRQVAYCTVPNYPLRVGQTSFDWGTEDNDATAFATVHPNPTNGQVTVTGKALRQAEVVNMLGQRVATIAGDGDLLHIDMGNLPKGVYFVRIKDDEGRTCVHKVVKE